MIKEVRYTGFTATPSDYESLDGELDAALNLVPEDGELKPVQGGEELLQLPGGEGVLYKVLFTHITSTYRHVIIVKETHDGGSLYDSQLYWLNVSNEGSLSEALKNADVTTMTAIAHHYTCNGEEGLSVSGIGNTLIVTGDTSGSMHYVLWKDSAYEYLGDHIPEIFLSFSLEGTVDYEAPQGRYEFDNTGLNIQEPARIGQSEYQQVIAFAANKISDAVMGLVVERAKGIIDSGHFIYPFFVRYALRLYDGTLTMHSAPILMNPCTTCNPLVYASSAGNNYVNVVAMFVKTELECLLLNNISDTSGLSNWEDIITGVDIFVTNQLCPYNQDGNINSIGTTTPSNGGTGTLRTSTDISSSVFIGTFNPEDATNRYYAQYKYAHIYGYYPRNADSRDASAAYQADTTDGNTEGTYKIGGAWPKFNFILPELPEEQMNKNIASESRFYYLQSIPLRELSEYATRKKIKFPVTKIDNSAGTGRRPQYSYESTLTSLLGQEVMTDDYHSHDKIAPNAVYEYNGRLNLAGIRRTLFNGFPLSAMLAYCNFRYSYTVESGPAPGGSRPQGTSHGEFNYDNNARDKFSIEVYLKINGEDKKIVCNLDKNVDGQIYGLYLQNYLSDYNNPDSWGIYLFYPDANAYKMRIIQRGYGESPTHAAGEYYEIELKPHDFLNGAYAYLDYNLVRLKTGDTDVPSDTSVTIDELGKIYTSDASNPFVFTTTNINTIGTGEILNLAAATKALSQGQFGQFPLYAFTTDGVWALEVASDGTFSSAHPVTRDVCINADGITQLDNAVIFSTDRGIMLLSGSDTACLTDSIMSEAAFSLPQKLDRLTASYPIVGIAADIVPFKAFLPGARMLYDYVHQRIIVYNHEKDYAYIYSLKSKACGMMSSKITYGINSYPECLAVDVDGNIINLSAVDADATDMVAGSQMLVTRALKLDAPDIHKTIDTIIQRGRFRKENIKGVVLYGSRDLFNWHLVYSSKDHYLRGFRGTPYKYFRIVVLGELKKDESLFGATIQYTPRLLDQPR